MADGSQVSTLSSFALQGSASPHAIAAATGSQLARDKRRRQPMGMPRATGRRDRRASYQVEALEPRLMLSVDISAFLVDVDMAFGHVEDTLRTDILGFPIPIVGDDLAKAADTVHDLRLKVRDIGQQLQTAIHTVSEVDDLLKLALQAAGFTPSQAGQLISAKNAVGAAVNDLATADSITVNLSSIQTETIAFGFDIGLPGLNFKASEGSIQASLSWALSLKLGFDTTDGFFIDTTGKEVALSADITLAPDFHAMGTLSLLQLGLTPGATPTLFHAEFGLDLDASGGQKRHLNELDTIFNDVGIGFKVDAHLDLHALVGVGLVYDDPTDLYKRGPNSPLPSLTVNFLLDWHVDSKDFSATNAPTVKFNDFTLNISEFVDGILKDVLGPVNQVLEPLQPILKVLKFELPLITKDMLNPSAPHTPATIVDLLGNPGLTKFVDALDVVSRLAGVAASGGIHLGSLDFSGYDLRIPPGQTIVGALQSIPIMDFANNVFGANSALTNLLGDALGAVDTVSQILNTVLHDIVGDPAPPSGISFPILKDPASIIGMLFGRNVDLVKIDLPKVGYETGPKTLAQIRLPIFPPLALTFKYEFGINFDLHFGYDTFGISQFVTNGDIENLLLGFYVDDRVNIVDPKFGLDPPEARLFASLSAEAGLDIVVASAGIRGSLEGTITANLHSCLPDRDGRIRFDEIAEALGGGGLGRLFDLGGGITFDLAAVIEIGIGPFSYSDEYVIFGPVTLIDFTHDAAPCDDNGGANPPPPALATLMADGTLLLNIGARATERNLNESETNEKYALKSVGQGVVEITAFGITQTYGSVGTKVKSVSGEAGAGKDEVLTEGNFEQVGGAAIKFRLLGEAGDDVLEGSFGDDVIMGGAGSDILRGKDGNDRVYANDASQGDAAARDVLYLGAGNDFGFGGAGDDRIFGEGGDDWLFGGDGKDRLFGGDGNDHIYGLRGNDGALSGDAGDDSVFGGEGNEIIIGGSGADFLSGDIDSGITDAQALALYGPGNTTISGNDVAFGGKISDARATLNAILDSEAQSGKALLLDYLRLLEPSIAESTPDNGVDGINTMETGGGLDRIVAGSQGDTIRSGADADVVYGGAGADTAFLGDGDDLAFGGDGADKLHGEASLDRIFGNAGGDTITGGGDADFLRGQGGGDDINGGDSADDIDGNEGDDTIRGGADGDLLRGSAGKDTIYGDGGDDDIEGNDGDDTLDGGAGNDKIRGNAGKDTVYGSADDDDIEGNDGDDTLDGGAGNDKIRGNAGKDTVYGGADDDDVEGNDGDDILNGGAGKDKIRGNLGNDRINGDDGDDDIQGNEGDDIATGGSGNDFIHGNLGNDRLFAHTETSQGTDTSVIDIIFGDNGDDAIFGGVGRDKLYGNIGNDLIFGGNNNDLIVGGAFDDMTIRFDPVLGQGIGEGSGNPAVLTDRDTLYGNDGDDTVGGGVDDDRIYGGRGGDILIGAAGADTIAGDIDAPITDPDAVRLYGTGHLANSAGSGADLITGDLVTHAVLDPDFVANDPDLANVKARLLAAEGLVGSGPEAGEADIIDGDDGIDVILAGGGPDIVRGGAGNDRIYGFSGPDTLDGGAGDDSIWGGADNDVITGGADNDTLRGGVGVDTISGNAGNDNLRGDAGADVLFGDDGTVVRASTFGPYISISTTGSAAGNDTIWGGVGSDLIFGGLGNDVLMGVGTNPNDLPTTGTDDDIIFGDTGRLVYNLAGLLDDGEGYADNNAATLDLAETVGTAGGTDEIYGNDGLDLVFGGGGADTIAGDHYQSGAVAKRGANDVLFGDNGRVRLFLGDIAVAHSLDEASGDADKIEGDDGADIIIGGAGADRLYGEAENLAMVNVGKGGDDIILGDNGDLRWNLESDNIPGRGITALDANLASLDRIMTTAAAVGGNDVIFGNAGSDVILGGAGRDDISGDTSDAGAGSDGADGSDLIFGDNGRVYPTLGKNATVGTPFFNAFFMTTDPGVGDIDTIKGNGKNDILLGGAGVDVVSQGAGVGLVVDDDTSASLFSVLNSNPNGLNGFLVDWNTVHKYAFRRSAV